MKSLERISPAEAENYIELSIYDNKVCTKAIAFTLTDVEGGIYPDSSYGTAWQQVTYYADSDSINNTSALLYPLEFMYKECDLKKHVDYEKD